MELVPSFLPPLPPPSLPPSLPPYLPTYLPARPRCPGWRVESRERSWEASRCGKRPPCRDDSICLREGAKEGGREGGGEPGGGSEARYHGGKEKGAERHDGKKGGREGGRDEGGREGGRTWHGATRPSRSLLSRCLIRKERMRETHLGTDKPCYLSIQHIYIYTFTGTVLALS
jgi:hypothetical protein